MVVAAISEAAFTLILQGFLRKVPEALRIADAAHPGDSRAARRNFARVCHQFASICGLIEKDPSSAQRAIATLGRCIEDVATLLLESSSEGCEAPQELRIEVERTARFEKSPYGRVRCCACGCDGPVFDKREAVTEWCVKHLDMCVKEGGS
jgi:hypothetical protein